MNILNKFCYERICGQSNLSLKKRYKIDFDTHITMLEP